MICIVLEISNISEVSSKIKLSLVKIASNFKKRNEKCAVNLFFSFKIIAYYNKTEISLRGRCGCDCMVVGFTTTCAISAYHH